MTMWHLFCATSTEKNSEFVKLVKPFNEVGWLITI